MEVVEEYAGLLSNFEVYNLLKEVKEGNSGQKKSGKSQRHFATILYSTLKYLETSPCKDQDPEQIKNFMTALVPFNLTPAEKMQLLNSRPQSAVEIQLMIEESEERLTEEQIDQLMDVIVTHLPSVATEEEAVQA